MNPSELYGHKPAQINTVSDMIAFFEGVPEDSWCVDRIYNEKGQHCAMGHLDEAYCDWGTKYPGFDLETMIFANNGQDEFGNRPTSRDISSPAIKARVLAYLRSLEPQSLPPASIMAHVTTLATVTA